MNTILKYLICFLTGGLLTHFWDKYKSRVTALKYRITYQTYGTTFDDPTWGSLKMTYNEITVKNLYNVTVYVQNDSNKDLKDLKFNIRCDDNNESIIILSYVSKVGGPNILKLTDEFEKHLGGKEPQYLLAQRDYKVPILNRGDQIEIYLLVTNYKNLQPCISVHCDHLGLKMEYSEKQPWDILGIPILQSLVAGLLMALISIPLILYNIPYTLLQCALIFIVAISYSLLGALLIKMLKMILRALS